MDLWIHISDLDMDIDLHAFTYGPPHRQILPSHKWISCCQNRSCLSYPVDGGSQENNIQEFGFRYSIIFKNVFHQFKTLSSGGGKIAALHRMLAPQDLTRPSTIDL